VPKLTLSFKGKLLKYFPIGEGETIIGSAPENTVFIDSLAIQPRHASITIEGDKAILRDLETPDGTFINNARVDTEYQLKSGDAIRVGKHNLIYTAEPAEIQLEPPAAVTPEERIPDEAEQPETAAAPAADDIDFEARAPRHAFLQILNGQNLGKTISLNRKLTNIGKSGVQMAVIAHRNDGYFLSHLEGEMPPKVGDLSIGDKAWQLNDSDVIQIGNIKMQFYLQ